MFVNTDLTVHSHFQVGNCLLVNIEFLCEGAQKLLVSILLNANCLIFFCTFHFFNKLIIRQTSVNLMINQRSIIFIPIL